MKKGFTLIELLIVIAILGILATVLFVLLNPIQKLQLARDGVRKGDIGNISRALNGYIVGVGKYPDTLAELAASERNVMPKDPMYPTYQYVYTADNSQNPPKYTLCAYLETEEKALCVSSDQGTSSTLPLDNPSVPQGLISVSTPTSTPVPTLVPTSTPTPMPGLIAHWKLNETTGTTTSDSTGNGNTGSLVNGPIWTSGSIDGGLQFDGNNDYITVPDTTSLRLGTQQTVTTWYKWGGGGSGDWRRLVGKGGNTDRNYGLWIYPQGNLVLFQVYSTGGSQICSAQFTVASDTNWHHLAGTYDGSLIKLYRDGSEVVSSSCFLTPVATNAPLTIGWANADVAPLHSPFDGTIDDVRIYGQVLNASQIAAMASSSTAPTPTTYPLATEYAVVPVIFLASDSVVPNESAYRSQVNASFAVVQTWYAGQLGGKTFTLEPAIFFRSSKTDAQLHSQYGTGIGIWAQGVKETTAANGMNYCDPKRNYYFVTPMDNIWGGMVGSENLGCSFVLPGTQSIPSHMGRMLGGVMDPNWPEWWADEIREAQGGVAHELGHGFGGECTNGNVYPGGGCNGLPHSYYPSIMYSWWDFGATGVFLDFEKTKILTSPYIH